MTLWEFQACAEGYRRANSTEDQSKPPTDQEDEALRQKYG